MYINTPIRQDLYYIILNYTLVKNESAVDVQHKEQSNNESVENPTYSGRGT